MLPLVRETLRVGRAPALDGRCSRGGWMQQGAPLTLLPVLPPLPEARQLASHCSSCPLLAATPSLTRLPLCAVHGGRGTSDVFDALSVGGGCCAGRPPRAQLGETHHPDFKPVRTGGQQPSPHVERLKGSVDVLPTLPPLGLQLMGAPDCYRCNKPVSPWNTSSRFAQYCLRCLNPLLLPPSCAALPAS